jgi:hypothetical protein
MKLISWLLFSLFLVSVESYAQKYPQGYFRNPLNIPMQLVANFGEIRANHWHMGLDIRTQQKENLPVYASADGFISRVVVEPGGFGQAIYIDHPNGYTTLYAHLNAFFPALAQFVKEQQYELESWKVDLKLSPGQFPVSRGTFIARSGNTGGSAGPHVHFEIRDTKTEKVLNPLLFNFPIADAVPPTLNRLVMYDRGKSTYAQQPQLLSIPATRNKTLKVGSNSLSFAIGAVDRFSGSANPNGIYIARVSVDDKAVSEFVLDAIDYNESRFINAQIDYPLDARGGPAVQHISPLPGAARIAYHTFNSDGIIRLNDELPHKVKIEVKDAYSNMSSLQFFVQYDPALKLSPLPPASEKLVPHQVNVFERESFELFSTEASVYDTVAVSFSSAAGSADAVSDQYSFLDQSIPVHDPVTVRLKPNRQLTPAEKERIVIKNISGNKIVVQKAQWQNGWLTTKFRQFGTYQAFIDDQPPGMNSVAADLSRARSIVIRPQDNFNSIKSFRAELDGRWIRFSNDKGKVWIYSFDEHFPRGAHELKITVEDEAGNITQRLFRVTR